MAVDFRVGAFLRCILLMLVCLLVGAPAQASRPAYRMGVHYDLIEPRQVSQASHGKVEVIEWFWYGCRNCYAIQKALGDWLDAHRDEVVYIRRPAVTEDDMIPLARVYYTAEALGVADRTHIQMFTALHAFRRKLDSEQSLQGFFADYGVSADAFSRAYHSARIDDDVRKARIMSKRYGLKGVPTLTVNGRYRVDAGHVSGVPQLIDVLDYLVALEKGALETKSDK
ncbi:MAG: thioredoxin domain-containing protein [Gammaproteobacteria bacterium]|nr:thioredoxin domain-containing protein [Gammaproteobacteria bacterium]